MAYEVLARKWRPRQFDEIVGQEHVVTTLKNAIESDRVAHAYLFVGPRGIGKTTTARILAKALNCVEGPTVHPCDKCDACREIAQGSSMDVIEIDGASNNGVEQVRSLRETVHYSPVRGRYRIYIIDEVHMLTTPAFNALLKTLEEPPGHVKFFFATTEPQKIPATVLSRCQRFDLRPLTVKEIVGRLEEICAAEGFDVDQDALLAIARSAEGSLRDAESALDQLVAFCGKKIREGDVMAVFGMVARRELEGLGKAILTGDAATALETLSRFDRAGKDMNRVLEELLEHFRNLLVYMETGGRKAEELLPAQSAALADQAALTDVEKVMRIVETLIEAEQKMRYAASPRLLLEAAIVRACHASRVVSVGELMKRLEQLAAAVAGDAASAGGGITAHRSATRTPATRSAAAAGGKDGKDGSYRTADSVNREGTAAKIREKPHSGDDCVLLSEHWSEIIERVGRFAPLAPGYLRDAKPLRVEGSKVVLGFDREFSSEPELINIPRNRKAITRVLSEFLGREVDIELRILDARDTLPADIKTSELDAAAGAAKQRAQNGKSSATGQSSCKSHPRSGRKQDSLATRQKWMQNGTVQKILEAFGGDIVDIRA